MLIVHGVRRSKTRLGLVADLCPRCRDIRPANVTQIEQYLHVYFIPVGQKKVVGHEVTCAGCRSTRQAAQVPYRDYCPTDPGDIGMLVELTNPDAVERLREHIELEDRVASGDATRDDRVRLIVQALSAEGIPLQSRLHSVLPTTAASLLAFIALAITWTLLLSMRRPEPIALYGVGAGVLLSLSVFVHSAATAKRRFVRRRVLPKIAVAIAPLRPSMTEITQAILTLRKNKLSLAVYTSPAALARAIQAVSGQPVPETSAAR